MHFLGSGVSSLFLKYLRAFLPFFPSSLLPSALPTFPFPFGQASKQCQLYFEIFVNNWVGLGWVVFGRWGFRGRKQGREMN